METSTATANPSPAEANLVAEEEEQVTLGVIASQGTFGQFAQVVSDTGGGAPGEKTSVLLGSVHRIKEGVCVGRIQNSGLKTYKVNLAVEGFDEKGKRIFSRNRRATLKPGQSIEKKIFGCIESSNLTLNLKSAKERKSALVPVHAEPSRTRRDVLSH